MCVNSRLKLTACTSTSAHWPWHTESDVDVSIAFTYVSNLARPGMAVRSLKAILSRSCYAVDCLLFG